MSKSSFGMRIWAGMGFAVGGLTVVVAGSLIKGVAEEEEEGGEGMKRITKSVNTTDKNDTSEHPATRKILASSSRDLSVFQARVGEKGSIFSCER